MAAAAEQAFTPYAEKVLEMMKGFMVLINDEDLCARARATEVVGIVAMAVGRARIEAILPPFIEASISVSCGFINLSYRVTFTALSATFMFFILAGFWIGLQ